jgi:hypothetical protein
MFHSSPRHHFDTMFVILCVIAGATSHSISNSNRTSPSYKLHDRHKSSFINFLLYENFTELVKQPEAFKSNLNASESNDHASVPALQTLYGKERETQDVCAQLSNVLSENQIRYCHKHYDILESILPQIIQLTKQECSRITRDLRWNCATIDLFLERSNPLCWYHTSHAHLKLSPSDFTNQSFFSHSQRTIAHTAFTKEAALVRSILNASMMYLIVKACSDHMHHSCGCQSNQEYPGPSSMLSKSRQNQMADSDANLRSSLDLGSPIDQVDLNRHELHRLETGSPLRLTRSMIRRQGRIPISLFLLD